MLTKCHLVDNVRTFFYITFHVSVHLLLKQTQSQREETGGRCYTGSEGSEDQWHWMKKWHHWTGNVTEFLQMCEIHIFDFNNWLWSPQLTVHPFMQKRFKGICCTAQFLYPWPNVYSDCLCLNGWFIYSYSDQAGIGKWEENDTASYWRYISDPGWTT